MMIHPPKLVFDEHGTFVEVILTAADFRTYLQTVLDDTPWDELPEHLQDAIDRLMIDDVRAERAQSISLEAVFDDLRPREAIGADTQGSASV